MRRGVGLMREQGYNKKMTYAKKSPRRAIFLVQSSE